MKTKHLSWTCLIILLLSLGVTTLNLVKVFSSPTAVVSVSPQRITVPPGQTFTLNTLVANVAGLNAWEFKLVYDPSVLYTNSTLIKEGPFLKSVGSTQFDKFVGPYYILVGSALLSSDTVDGSGTLAYVTFQVVHEGYSFLNLVKRLPSDPYDVGLWDAYAYNIANTAVDGYFSNFINVAVTNVVAFPKIASVGESVSINATVQNESNITETFDVTVYYNSTTIGTQPVTDLDLGAYAMLTFNWNTAGLAPGIYAISANASVVQGETYTEDNGLVYRWARLTMNPAAIFTFSPRFPLPSEIVIFNASSSFTPNTPNGTIVSYEWNFGDGNTTTVLNQSVITHVYTSLGTYNVTLNVTDNFGKWNARYKLVAVKSLPTASFTFSPATPKVNEVVTFDASDSSDPDGSIVSYRWDFGDGNVTTVSDSTITHAYTLFGPYTVTLNVTDTDEHWDTYTKTLTVKSLPTASFTFLPVTPKVNEIVTFNASASFDPDGSIAKYAWTFGDGGTGAGKIATHVYASFGSYTVTLKVTDNDGFWDAYTKTVTVKSLPTASFTFSPVTPKVNEVVTFDASASSDPDGSIVSYRWDFGDGNVTTVSGSTITHAYAEAKSYTVTLTVTDNDGFTDVQTTTVPVEEAPQTNFLLYVGVAVIIVIVATLLFYFGRRKR